MRTGALISVWDWTCEAQAGQVARTRYSGPSSAGARRSVGPVGAQPLAAGARIPLNIGELKLRWQPGALRTRNVLKDEHKSVHLL